MVATKARWPQGQAASGHDPYRVQVTGELSACGFAAAASGALGLVFAGVLVAAFAGALGAALAALGEDFTAGFAAAFADLLSAFAGAEAEGEGAVFAADFGAGLGAVRAATVSPGLRPRPILFAMSRRMAP